MSDQQNLTSDASAPAAAPAAENAAAPAVTPVKSEAPAPKAGETPSSLVPEKYEFVAPEGVPLDPEMLKVFEGQAREFGLNNDQANKLIAFYAKGLMDIEAKAEAESTEWQNATRADPEIGGKNLDGVLSTALKAIDSFASPGMKALLAEKGLGNHPEFIRFAWKIGQAMGEDSTIRGGQRSSAPQSLADRMYPR